MDDYEGFAESLAAKSDQINAADLIGGPMTIKIAGLKVQKKEQQKWTFRLEGNEKFYRPCLGMRRLIAQLWGDPRTYAGQSLTIYRDPEVRYSAKEVGGIRISHMTGLDEPQRISVPISRAAHKEYIVQPLRVSTPKPAAPVRNEAAEASAKAAAGKGKQAFTDWWNSDYGKENREAVKGIMTDLQKMVADFEAANQADDEAPM